MGRLVRADGAGLLPRLGRAPKGILGTAVTNFATVLHERIGDPDLSIVVRGSLARGGRNPADIDLMIISQKTPTLPELPPLPLPVEIGLVPLHILQDPVRGAWPRFALAHGGWTLAGPERLCSLPDPRLGPVAIAHLQGLRRWWPQHPLDWAINLAERRMINGWLAKRILRSLAEGEMVRRGVYSRDIWPCLQVASDAFPEHSRLLRDVAEQAVEPSGTYKDRLRLLQTRPLLERAFARHLHKPIRLSRS